ATTYQIDKQDSHSEENFIYPPFALLTSETVSVQKTRQHQTNIPDLCDKHHKLRMTKAFYPVVAQVLNQQKLDMNCVESPSDSPLFIIFTTAISDDLN
ncbi:MAG: hypothetical protein RR390_07990, partial [Hafnia sp.]